MAIIIGSNDTIPVETTFRISAGPGAGKTHWLINHIKNVSLHSERLGTNRMIACITYTNVGVDTIKSRLGTSSASVEVSTIHSFLYSHVVKPFLYLIAEEEGLKLGDISIIDDAPLRNYGFANRILNANNISWIDTDCYLQGLKEAQWRYHEGNFTFKPKQGVKTGEYWVPNYSYLYFKKALWRNGRLTYDDIAYLSVKILKDYPFIYRLIKAKYPYFFLDEFQDSTPWQINILKKLRDEGVVVGVIGDKYQSIYAFTGANVQQFEGFSIDGLTDFEIRGNRRSSTQIVELLNVLRPDFSQTTLSGLEGPVPKIIIGDKLQAFDFATRDSGIELHTLSYPNVLANTMRFGEAPDETNDLMKKEFDSNPVRPIYVKALVRAVEYAVDNNLRDAWRELDILFNDRTEAITHLRMLLHHRDELMKQPLSVLLDMIIEKINPKIKKPKGTIKTFYDTHTYCDLAAFSATSDSNVKHKTIHKSKGDEYDGVMLILDSAKDINFLLAPKLDTSEPHRVYYVACSRARRLLYINVPELSEAQRKQLKKRPVEIIEI